MGGGVCSSVPTYSVNSKKKEKTELGVFVCLSLNKTKIFMFRSERTNRKDGECD